jgi:glyoxylase-like metal-dependent hydrolase (beta-lactamase superfamily II)
MREYLASLRRLRQLEIGTLFPAHGPAVHGAAGKLDELIRHREWRERRILHAWQAGRRQPGKILEVAYEGLAPVARPLAERQIFAHLEHLRAQGRLHDLES